jgi:multicomponent Na+:H+ antiporter subunit E
VSPNRSKASGTLNGTAKTPPTPARWMRFVLTSGGFYGIWITLSGRFSPQYLIIGAVGSIIITAGLFPWRTARPFPVLRFLAFVPWLLGQVVLSNLRVAKTAVSPLSAIDPQFVRVPPSMGSANSDEGALTVLGCAITLTPGTLTIDIAPDNLYVHALDAASARDIREGIMAQRVARVFRGKGDGA